MRVKSIANQGKDLSPRALARPGQTMQAMFNITPGREYQVYAMSLSDYDLSILVVSLDNHRPYWVPIDLFEIIDGEIPANWEFAVIRDHPIIRSLWGYHSLIHNGNHHDDLIDRKLSAKDAFLRDNDLRTLEEA